MDFGATELPAIASIYCQQTLYKDYSLYIFIFCTRWVGYQHPNYAGDQSLFLKGQYEASDKPNDEGGFKNDRISSFGKIMLVSIRLDKFYFITNS